MQTSESRIQNPESSRHKRFSIFLLTTDYWLLTTALLCSLFSAFCFLTKADAYWEWTPQTRRWINPKYAVKSTPKEQFKYAEGFEKEDIGKAIREHRKLIKHYPCSSFAIDSQFHLGVLYQKSGDFKKAFYSYQEVIEKYPSAEMVKECLEEEYQIAYSVLTGKVCKKILGVKVGISGDISDFFEKIIKNSPYGKYAPLSQYNLGLYYLKVEKWEKAIEEFQQVIDLYPESSVIENAVFGKALANYYLLAKRSRDQKLIESAIEKFSEFTKTYPESPYLKEAKEKILELREILAERIYEIGLFYEKRKEIKGAILYYEKAAKEYPETEKGKLSAEKVSVLKKEMR